MTGERIPEFDIHGQDVVGNPLTADETELLELYQRLRAMSARTDLAPVAAMNAKQAMVCLWNACVGLGLMYNEPDVD